MGEIVGSSGVVVGSSGFGDPLFCWGWWDRVAPVGGEGKNERVCGGFRGQFQATEGHSRPTGWLILGYFWALDWGKILCFHGPRGLVPANFTVFREIGGWDGLDAGMVWRRGGGGWAREYHTTILYTREMGMMEIGADSKGNRVENSCD